MALMRPDADREHIFVTVGIFHAPSVKYVALQVLGAWVNATVPEEFSVAEYFPRISPLYEPSQFWHCLGDVGAELAKERTPFWIACICRDIEFAANPIVWEIIRSRQEVGNVPPDEIANSLDQEPVAVGVLI
jgi:hypothetical protein